MIKIAQSFTAEIAKVCTTFHVLSMEKKQDSSENKIPYGYAVCEGSALCLVRVGAIESELDVNDLIEILNFISKQEKRTLQRIASQQFQKPETEYSAIVWQHLLLQSNEQCIKVAHLDLRNILLFKSGEEIQKNTDATIFAKLVNSEGWLRYCDWFYEELKKIPFYPDMLDIYQVEARVNDYEHEIESPILKSLRTEINEIVHHTIKTIIALKDVGAIKNILAEAERKLLKLRLSIQENLKNISFCLQELISYITTVEKPHPELMILKQEAVILNSLIREDLDLYIPSTMSWIKRILLLSLLDISLEIIPIINSAFDSDKTAACFALKLAIMQLVRQGKAKSLLRLALDWDEVILKINQLYLERGAHLFEEWLRESKEHSELHHQAQLVHLLRFCVYKNLQNFCFPFLKSDQTPTKEELEKLSREMTSDYLELIPEIFVVYDPSTFKAEALTLEGIQRLQLLFHNR